MSDKEYIILGKLDEMSDKLKKLEKDCINYYTYYTGAVKRIEFLEYFISYLMGDRVMGKHKEACEKAVEGLRKIAREEINKYSIL